MTDLNKIRIGLSLRGGGMRAVAYIGFLKYMEEISLQPTAIVGSSGGAVVGGSYSHGKTIEQIYHHFKIFQPVRQFNPLVLIKDNGLKYTQWLDHAHSLVGNIRIEDAPIPYAVQATNINTNQVEYIDSGPAVSAVIASSAVISPFEYQGQSYIDGDFDPEVGVAKLRELGADFIIGLSVAAKPNENLLSGLSILQNNALGSSIMLEQPHIFINILTKGDLLNKQHLEDDFEVGYKVAKQLFTNLLASRK